MLGISIVTINGVDQGKGIVNQNRSTRKGRKVRTNCKEINEIEITKLRVPELRDRLAVRHGRYIEQDADDKKTLNLNEKI